MLEKSYKYIKDNGKEIEVHERSIAYVESLGWKIKKAKKEKAK